MKRVIIVLEGSSSPYAGLGEVDFPVLVEANILLERELCDVLGSELIMVGANPNCFRKDEEYAFTEGEFRRF